MGRKSTAVIDTATLCVEYVEKYEYCLRYDEEEKEYFATVAEYPHISVFAETDKEALAEAKNVVEDILLHSQKKGLPLPTPKCRKKYSGKFIVRIPTGLHRKLAQKAEAQNTTLNSFVTSALSEYICR